MEHTGQSPLQHTARSDSGEARPDLLSIPGSMITTAALLTTLVLETTAANFRIAGKIIDAFSPPAEE